MSTVYFESPEPYTSYGLTHFSKKFDIAISTDQLNADIHISYSCSDNLNSKVQIILCRNTTEKICDLEVSGEKIPLFILPQEQSGDQIIWKIIDGDREYPCIFVDDNQIKIGFDIFKQIGKILAGDYDPFFLRTDELGKTLRRVSVVDIMEEALFFAINENSPGLLKRFAWPDNHKFALVLTHDVDRVYKTYQYLPSIFNSLKQAKLADLVYHLKNLCFKHGRNNPYWTFDNLIELEKSLGVKSTYYFLNEKGKHNPFSLQSWILYRGVYDIESLPIKELIKSLSINGNEIGVHGSYNSFSNAELMRIEKQTLESITGSKVKGIRQHYLNYDNHVTPGIQCQSGFEYDSSIGFKPDIGVGFRRGTSFPFKIMQPDHKITDLLQIPLIIMDGALDKATKIEECYKLVEQVEKYGGVLTILWHTQRFSSKDYPSMSHIYEGIIKEARGKGAWIATANEVNEWIKGIPTGHNKHT